MTTEALKSKLHRASEITTCEIELGRAKELFARGHVDLPHVAAIHHKLTALRAA